jgi:nucleotide-binding universal stress UspA family protein
MDASVQLAKKAGVPTDALVDVGQPATDIVSRAASLGADLIVIGTHGMSGFDHVVLGSVAEKVLRRATCPVVTVPPRARATSTLPFRRILCSVDFSEPSVAAVGFALSLAQGSGATVTLLHVLQWPWEEPPAPAFGELPSAQAAALAEYRAYTETSALARLRGLATGASAGQVRIATRLLNGKPYKGILQAAAEDTTDLIVIGVHGRGVADTTLLGSTTNQVVRRATCPVLTIRS